MREFRLEVAAPMMVTVLSPVEFQFCNLHFEPVTTKLLLQVQAWATLYPACPSISLQKKRTVEEWEKAARSTCALPLLSGLCQSSTQRALLIKSEGFLLKKKILKDPKNEQRYFRVSVVQCDTEWRKQVCISETLGYSTRDTNYTIIPMRWTVQQERQRQTPSSSFSGRRSQ